MAQLRIVIPYACSLDDWRLQATVAALESQGLKFSLHDTSQSPDSYYQLVSELWKEQHTVLFIEHDICVYPGLAQKLARCSSNWCAAPYIMLGEYETALGCSKFSGELMKLLPDLPQLVKARPDNYFEHKVTGEGTYFSATSWPIQDQVWTGILREHGFEPCIHTPAVTHLNTKYHTVSTDIEAP